MIFLFQKLIQSDFTGGTVPYSMGYLIIVRHLGTDALSSAVAAWRVIIGVARRDGDTNRGSRRFLAETSWFGCRGVWQKTKI